MASNNLWSSLNSSANSVYKLTAEKISSSQLLNQFGSTPGGRKQPTSPPPSSDSASRHSLNRADGVGFSGRSWIADTATTGRDEQDQELRNLREALTQAEQQNLMLTEEFQRIMMEKDKEIARVRSAVTLATSSMTPAGEQSWTANGADSARLESLQQQNAELTMTLDKLKVKARAKILELQGNVDSLQKEVAEKQGIINELNPTKLTPANADAVSGGDGRVRELERERDALRRDFEKQLEADASSLRAELASTAALAEAERRCKEELSVRMSSLESEIRNLQDRAAESERELSSFKSELYKANAAKKELEIQLTRERAELANTNEALQRAQNVVSDINDLPSQQDSEATGGELAVKIAELKTMLETLRRGRDEVVAASSVQACELRRNINELQSALCDTEARHAMEVETLEQKNYSLDTARQRVEQHVTALSSELEAARASEKNIQVELSTLGETLNAERSAAQRHERELQAQISKLQAAVGLSNVSGEAELDELRRRNEELKSESDLMRERLTANEREAAAQQNSLETELRNQVERVSELESEFVRVQALQKAETEKLKRNLDDMQRLKTQLQGALEAERADREALAATEEHIQGKLNATLSSLGEAESSSVELRAETAALKLTVADLEAQVEAATKREEAELSWREAKNIAEREVETLRSELQRLSEQAQAASARADEEHKAWAMMQTEVQRLHAEVSELRKQAALLHKEKEEMRRELEEERQEFQATTSSLDSKLECERAAHKDLQNVLQVQEEEIAELNRRFHAKEEALFAAKQEICKVREQFNSTHTSLTDLSRELENEKDESRKASQSYTSLRATHSETSKLLEKVREDATTAQERYQSVKVELAAAMSRLAEARKVEQAADGLRAELESLRNELRVKSGLVDSMEAELEVARGENQERSASQQVEMERLQHDATEKDELVHKLRDEVDELKEELAELAGLHAAQMADITERHERELRSTMDAATADSGAVLALKAEMHKQSAAKTAAIADAERAQSRVKTINDQLSRLQSEHKALREQSHGRIRALEKENSKFEEEVRRLQSAVNLTSPGPSESRSAAASSSSIVASSDQQPPLADLLERVEFYTLETARLQNENSRLKRRLVAAEQTSRYSSSREVDQWDVGGGGGTTLAWTEEAASPDDLEAPGARSSVIVKKGRNRVRRTLRNIARAADRESLRFLRYLNSKPAARLGLHAYLFLLHGYLAYMLLAGYAITSSSSSSSISAGGELPNAGIPAAAGGVQQGPSDGESQR